MENKSSLSYKISQGIVWTLLQNFGNQVIRLCVFFLLVRLLKPTDFGLVALSTVFIDFVRFFLNNGFPAAIVQREHLDQEHLDTAFWFTLSVGLVLTIISFFSAEIVADVFKQTRLAPIIRWLSLTFFLSALNQLQIALLRRHLSLKIITTRTMLAGIIGGVIGVLMAFSGFGAWSLVGRHLAEQMTGVLILWSSTSWRPGFKISRQHFRDLFRFGISMMGSNMLIFLNRRADDFLIGYVLGPVALGYYSVAYRLLSIMTESWSHFYGNVAFPAFSRIQSEKKKLRQMYYSGIRLISLISFPLCLGIFVLAPQLVPVLFGEQWIQSVPVMQLLVFIGLLHSLLLFDGTIIVSTGNPQWYLKYQALTTIGNVIGFLIAVQWGINAVALSYVIVGYLFAPISLLLVRRLIEIDLSHCVRQYLPSMVGSFIMVSFICVFMYTSITIIPLEVLLTICIVMSILTYAITIRLIFPSLAENLLKSAKTAYMNLWTKGT
ncbi:MAG: lipopolysaccharide biosynthesis protein [Nitrospinales bacterium]